MEKKSNVGLGFWRRKVTDSDFAGFRFPLGKVVSRDTMVCVCVCIHTHTIYAIHVYIHILCVYMCMHVFILCVHTHVYILCVYTLRTLYVHTYLQSGCVDTYIAHIFYVFVHEYNLLVAQMVKNLPALWETQVQSLSRDDPVDEGMATHSHILGWEIPQAEESGRLPSMGSQSTGHD